MTVYRIATDLALFALLGRALPLLAQQRVLMTEERGMLRTEIDTTGSAATFSAPAPQVYDALKAVYKDLGVKLESVNDAMYEAGNIEFWKARTFAGKRISTFLNCGNNMTGPNADSYRVYMSLIGRVSPVGDGSSLVLVFQANARNVMEGSREPVACGSNGKFELRFLNLVKEKLEEAMKR